MMGRVGTVAKGGRRRRCMLVFGAVLVALLAGFAIPAAAKNVNISTDGKVRYTGSKGEAVIDGNIKIEYGDTLIFASHLLFNDGTKVARLTGGVRVLQGDVTINADAMDANFSKDTALLTGSVKLQKKETLEEKDASGKPKVSTTNIASNVLEIAINTQDFVASGSVVITKDKQRAQAAKAEYTDAKKMLLLTGSVFIEGDNKETIKCDKATLYTDNDTVEAEGKAMEITFMIED